VETALTRAPRVAIARADSAIGRAKILTARAYPNPTIALVYTKDTPQRHVELEQPFEWGGVRSARKHAAEASLLAATYNLAAERAALRFDVEVAYVRAAGAQAIMRLSVRNAADAAELLRITRARQAAGDASELEVRIAAVFAGQAQNQTFTDSLDAATTLLELQSLMGIQSTGVDIVLTDSLEAITTASTDSAIALRTLAARAELSSEQANLRLASRSRWPAPSLRTGFDWHDPEGTEKGLLPILGIVLPLPIWDRHRGEIAEARATITRANASLELVQLETRNALAIAERERDVSRLKVERGRAVVQEAERVAALTITAYRDGAQPLASVLEAQRSARDALRDFVVNLQDSRIAEAAFVRAHIVGGSRQ
jgi:cobalt-zinc-cadmium efflux system outer membrane protein